MTTTYYITYYERIPLVGDFPVTEKFETKDARNSRIIKLRERGVDVRVFGQAYGRIPEEAA